MTVDKDASQSVIARATAQFNSGQSTTTRSNTNDTIRASTSNEAAQPESGGGITRSSSPALTPSQRAQIQFQEQNQARESEYQVGTRTEDLPRGTNLADYGTAGIVFGMKQKQTQYQTLNTNPMANSDRTIAEVARRRGLSISQIEADLATAEPATMYSDQSGARYYYPKSADTSYKQDLSRIAANRLKDAQIRNKQDPSFGMLERTSATITYPSKPTFPIGDAQTRSERRIIDLGDKISEKEQTYADKIIVQPTADKHGNVVGEYGGIQKTYETKAGFHTFPIFNAASLMYEAATGKMPGTSIGEIPLPAAKFDVEPTLRPIKTTRTGTLTNTEQNLEANKELYRAGMAAFHVSDENTAEYDRQIKEISAAPQNTTYKQEGKNITLTRAEALNYVEDLKGNYISDKFRYDEELRDIQATRYSPQAEKARIASDISLGLTFGGLGGVSGAVSGAAQFTFAGLAGQGFNKMVLKETGDYKLASLADSAMTLTAFAVTMVDPAARIKTLTGADIKIPTTERPFTGIAKGEQPFNPIKAGERPFTGLAKGEKPFTGLLTGNEKPLTLKFNDLEFRQPFDQPHFPPKTKEITPRDTETFYYVNDPKNPLHDLAYRQRNPITVEKTGASKLDRDIGFKQDYRRQLIEKTLTKKITKDITKEPEPKIWGIQKQKPAFDLTGDFVVTKLTKGEEKAASERITLFDTDLIRFKPTSNKQTGKKIDRGNLLLMQKEEPKITEPLLKKITIVEKTGASKLDKKIMRIREQKTDGVASYYTQSRQYAKEMYDSSAADLMTRSDIGYNTIRHPTNSLITIGALGLASALTQTNRQTQREQQTQALIPNLRINQVQTQREQQTQVQKLIQQQQQTEKQTEELTRTLPRLTDIIETPRQPEFIPPELKSIQPPPTPTLFIPPMGGGSGPLRKRGSGFRPGYQNTLRHPIMTPAQVNQILYPTRRRR